MNSTSFWPYAISNQHIPHPPVQQTNHTRLPSIHSLSLDLPSLQQNPSPASVGGLVLPLHGNSYALPSFASNNRALPYVQASSTFNTYLPQPQKATLLLPNNLSNNSTNSSNGTAQYSTNSYTSSATSSRLLSPISSPYSRGNSSLSSDTLNGNVPAYSTSRNRASSDPLVKSELDVTSPFQSVTPPLKEEDSSDEVMTESESTSPPKKSWKPRKKRQCPECKLYFSNLATHKSTHLKPTSRPHICKYCNRGFARPNDLFRHIKCHWKEIGSDKGQFKCPFKNTETGDTNGAPDHCCHNTGIFSRCDTFKNHLKAIHFQYPNGTKKDQRTKVSGKCRMCQAEFRNVDDWLANHIERNNCPSAVNMVKKE
ncbi:tRNA splicing protein [Scheffersomyces xylosifermentans]|uniref:tRNA splicing protein n=1 Tax=Scheffersomyces xylosifermentans TaxID=1304137 RepID=UPI00315D52D2